MLISRHLHNKSSEVSIKTRSTPASLSFNGQATKHTTVKWSIPGYVLGKDNREFSCGPGVGLFIKSEYNFHIRDDLRLNAIENLWVETQDLIVASIQTMHLIY